MLKNNFVITLIGLLFLSQVSFAHVDLISPEGGETFIAGDTVTIKWVQVQAHDTQNWELYYSPDAGDSWQTITTTIAVDTREFLWVIPDEETTEGRIRVVQNNSDTDFQDMSANFAIVQVTGIDESGSTSLAVSSFVNYPNPFRKSTTFSFTLVDKEYVSLTIFQSNGSQLMKLVQNVMQKGEHTVEWLPAYVSPGIYFAVFEVGNKTKTIKLQYMGS